MSDSRKDRRAAIKGEARASRRKSLGVKIPRKFEYAPADSFLRAALAQRLMETGRLPANLGVYSTEHPRPGEKPKKRFFIQIEARDFREKNDIRVSKRMNFTRRLFTCEKFLQRATEAILRKMPYLISESL